MTKKMVLVLILVVLTVGVASAQIQMSAGVGATFRANWSANAWTKDGRDWIKPMDENIFDSSLVGGGFFAFFDATYAMASLGFDFHGVSPMNSDERKQWKDNKMTMGLSTFEIGLLGKFPINLGGLTVFPAVGMDIRIAIAQDATVDGKYRTYNDKDHPTNWERKNRSVAGDLTNVWFKFGGGVDIPLMGQLYVRPMFLYGFGTLNRLDQKQQDDLNKNKGDWEGSNPGKKTLYSQVNHGFDITVAAGYKF